MQLKLYQKRFFIVFLSLLIISSLSYVVRTLNELCIEEGKPKTIWVQSQNGNDDGAMVNVKYRGEAHAKLEYSVEKYAEVGIIVLPDINTIFPSLLDGRKIRDINVAPSAEGLTIIDHNKTSSMDGIIKYWKVASKEDSNEVRLAVFRYDDTTKKYRLADYSAPQVARKGLNTFFEEQPVNIRQADILGLQAKKSISSNRVMINELANIYSRSGFQNIVDRSGAVEDAGSRGSYSFSALLEVGKTQGEIVDQHSTIKLPQTPVYGHVSWYKVTLTSDGGVFSLKPGLASILLNADPYIGLVQATGSPWTPRAFSFPLLVSLVLLFICTTWLISPESVLSPRVSIAMASTGVLIIFSFTRYFSASVPGFQFVTILASFIMVFLLPGVIASRYYHSYGHENVSGRIVLAFVLSLVCWLLPVLGLFLVRTSYWPVITAFIFLIVLVFFKQPAWQKRDPEGESISLYWKIFQFVLWGFVGLWAVQTLFSSRFHAELFDSFHHLSIAAKYSELPIVGDLHPNLYGVTMHTVAPYAYNLWSLLVGMVVKISGLDIGTIYCVGSSLLVLLTFIAQWWLIGLFVDSEKIKISAFAIIIIIYVTRTLATFAAVFQRTEFAFIVYGPSVHEFVLYAVYIALGIRAIHSKRSADLLIYCGLSLAMAFFHLEFVFFNALVLLLLIVLSLREHGKFCLSSMHVYLLATIALLGVASFAVTSHLALGAIADASSPYYATYYALRYEEHTVLQRFYYIFKDLLRTINTYIWSAVAIWGGLLQVVFRSKKISTRLFYTTYSIIILMLLFSYNPISEMVFTPLMTSWPVKRIEIYLKAMTFTFAAIVLSVMISGLASALKKNFKHANKIVYAIPSLLLGFGLLTYEQWLPQLHSTLSTITYNRGNYVDITYIANLPEVKFLNEYSKGKYINALIERPYNYILPSLSRTYSYFHSHYPKIESQSSYFDRETIWEKCLIAENSCTSLLPKDSLLVVRNDNTARFIKIGYAEIYRGRLFTVLKV